MARSAIVQSSLAEHLHNIVGAENVLLDEADRLFHATDVYSAGLLPQAVVRPSDTAQIAQIVTLCAAHDIALIARGGGSSYTEGYQHKRENGITIDTSRMDAIAIDETNAIVIVGAGVRWATLHQALADKGWRTPFWGPFSGLAATVGGSMSQNSLSHGTGGHGISAESLLGLEVVTGTGEILRTGSWGTPCNTPFARFFGPDMTGLFTGDCGALGVKCRLALRMIRTQPAFDAVSFSFDSFSAMHQAMQQIAAQHLDDENFAIDQALQQGQIARQDSTGARLDVMREVMKAAPSKISGIKQLAAMAFNGQSALKASPFATHYLMDGVDGFEARAKARAIRDIGRKFGTEIPNTVPKVVRAMPFAPLFNTLGPGGERWVPIHGIFAHDAVGEFHDALTSYRASQADEMQRLGIWQGFMFSAIGASGFLYEPATYWPGAHTAYHRREVPADYLDSLPKMDDNQEVEDKVAEIKADMIALMHRHGAIHFQIGKVYPYLDDYNPQGTALMHAIKAQLDPHRILNPGALGL